MLSNNSASRQRLSGHFNTSPTCFAIRFRVLLKQWKQCFSPRRNVLYPLCFPSNWNQRNLFCVVVLLLVKHLRFIAWQSTSHVTTYGCILCQISWLEFHTENRAMTSFECSFRGHSKKECGVSTRYKHQTALLPLKTCSKDVSDHLNGCYKTTSAGVEVEWQLCLSRAGLFEEAGESFTICPLHRDEFGLGWWPSKVCKHPLHDSKQKPVRGVTLRMSQEIQSKYKILCEIGQG